MGRPGCGCCIECATTYKVNKDTGRIEWAKNLGINTLAIAHSKDRIYVSMDRQDFPNSSTLTEVEGKILSFYEHNTHLAFELDNLYELEIGDRIIISIEGGQSEVNLTIKEILDDTHIVTDATYTDTLADMLTPIISIEFNINRLESYISKYDIVVLDESGRIIIDECISVLPDNHQNFTDLYANEENIYAVFNNHVYHIKDKKIQTVIPVFDFHFYEKKFYVRNPTPSSFVYLERLDDGYRFVQKVEINELNADNKTAFNADKISFDSMSGTLENITVYDFNDYQYKSLNTYSGEAYPYIIAQDGDNAKITFESGLITTYPILSLTEKGPAYSHRGYFTALDISKNLNILDSGKAYVETPLYFSGLLDEGPLFKAMKGAEPAFNPGYGYRIIDVEKKTSEYDYMKKDPLDSKYEPIDTYYNIKGMPLPAQACTINLTADKQDKISFNSGDLIFVDNQIGNFLGNQANILARNIILRDKTDPTARYIGCEFVPDTLKANVVDGKITQHGKIIFIYCVYSYTYFYDKEYTTGNLEFLDVTPTTESIAYLISNSESRSNLSSNNCGIVNDGYIKNFSINKYRTIDRFISNYVEAQVTYDIGSKNYEIELLKDEPIDTYKGIGSPVYSKINNDTIELDINNLFNPIYYGQYPAYFWSFYEYYNYTSNNVIDMTLITFEDRSSYTYKLDDQDQFWDYTFVINEYQQFYVDNSILSENMYWGAYALNTTFAGTHNYLINPTTSDISYNTNYLYNDAYKIVFQSPLAELNIEDLVEMQKKFITYEVEDENKFYPINSRSQILYVDDKDYIVTDSLDGDRQIYTSSMSFYTVANDDVAPIESSIFNLYYGYRGTLASGTVDITIPIGNFEAYTQSGGCNTMYQSGVLMTINVESTTGEEIVERLNQLIDYTEKPTIEVLEDGPLSSGEITLLIDNTGKELSLTLNEFTFSGRLLLKKDSMTIAPQQLIESRNPINHSAFNNAFSHRNKIVGFRKTLGGIDISNNTIAINQLTTSTRDIFKTEQTNTNLFNYPYDYDGEKFIPLQDAWILGHYYNPTVAPYDMFYYIDGAFTSQAISNRTKRDIADLQSSGWILQINAPTYNFSGQSYGSQYCANQTMDEFGLEAISNNTNSYVIPPTYNDIRFDGYGGKRLYKGDEYYSNNSNFRYSVVGKAFEANFEDKESGNIRNFDYDASSPAYTDAYPEQNRPFFPLDPNLSVRFPVITVDKSNWRAGTPGGVIDPDSDCWRKYVKADGTEVDFDINTELDANGPYLAVTNKTWDMEYRVTGYFSGDTIRTLKIEQDTDGDYKFIYEEEGILDYYAENAIAVLSVTDLIYANDWINPYKGFTEFMDMPISNNQAFYNGQIAVDFNIPKYRYYVRTVHHNTYITSDLLLNQYGYSSGITVVYCDTTNGTPICYNNLYSYQKITQRETDIEPLYHQRYGLVKNKEIDEFIVGPQLEDMNYVGWGNGGLAPYPTEHTIFSFSGDIAVQSGMIIDGVLYQSGGFTKSKIFYGSSADNVLGPIPNVTFEKPSYIVGVKESGLISKSLSRTYNQDTTVDDTTLTYTTLESLHRPVTFWGFAQSGAYQELLPTQYGFSFFPIAMKNSGSIYENEKFNILAFDENGLVWKNNYLMNPRKFNDFMEYNMDKNDFDHDKLIIDVASSKEALYLTGQKRKKITSLVRNSGDIQDQDRVLANSYCGEDKNNELNLILDTTYYYTVEQPEENEEPTVPQ